MGKIINCTDIQFKKFVFKTIDLQSVGFDSNGSVSESRGRITYEKDGCDKEMNYVYNQGMIRFSHTSFSEREYQAIKENLAPAIRMACGTSTVFEMLLQHPVLIRTCSFLVFLNLGVYLFRLL